MSDPRAVSAARTCDDRGIPGMLVEFTDGSRLELVRAAGAGPILTAAPEWPEAYNDLRDRLEIDHGRALHLMGYEERNL